MHANGAPDANSDERAVATVGHYGGEHHHRRRRLAASPPRGSGPAENNGMMNGPLRAGRLLLLVCTVVCKRVCESGILYASLRQHG